MSASAQPVGSAFSAIRHARPWILVIALEIRYGDGVISADHVLIGRAKLALQLQNSSSRASRYEQADQRNGDEAVHGRNPINRTAMWQVLEICFSSQPFQKPLVVVAWREFKLAALHGDIDGRTDSEGRTVNLLDWSPPATGAEREAVPLQPVLSSPSKSRPPA